MVDSLGFYALLLLGFLCLGVLYSWLWLRRPVAMESTDRRPAKPSTRRSAKGKHTNRALECPQISSMEVDVSCGKI
jgi:hypothetical protein